MRDLETATLTAGTSEDRRPIARLAVLGAGLMGAGIAQTAAQAGLDVVLYDIGKEPLTRGLGQIRHSLSRVARAGDIDEDPTTILGRITPTQVLSDAVGSQELVIEAAPEQLKVKLELFATIDQLAAGDCILATNTSQFSITELAAATSRPESIVGLHFFNPVPVMPLVEVIPGLATTAEVMGRAVAFCRQLGKQTVVAKDVPGFIATRGNLAFHLECHRMVEEGVASAEDIDQSFRLGFGHPMGPLELGDYVGLDTLLSIADAMRLVHGERFRAPLILRQLVAAGHYGRKTGRGFYDYEHSDLEVRG